eukprot:GHVT01005482.1.p1 GENE.GHVT01005482.1~~GHVT01005482.1.p1  ORF type:complete len:172 (+),score=13.18 GHVT01005482.1:711-1226(+)
MGGHNQLYRGFPALLCSPVSLRVCDVCASLQQLCEDVRGIQLFASLNRPPCSTNQSSCGCCERIISRPRKGRASLAIWSVPIIEKTAAVAIRFSLTLAGTARVGQPSNLLSHAGVLAHANRTAPPWWGYVIFVLSGLCNLRNEASSIEYKWRISPSWSLSNGSQNSIRTPA